MEPRFAVIDPKPGFRKTVDNFNQDDYARIAFLTIGPTVVSPIPRVIAAPICFLLGFSYAYAQSSLRLKGYIYNYEDVKFHKYKNKER